MGRRGRETPNVKTAIFTSFFFMCLVNARIFSKGREEGRVKLNPLPGHHCSGLRHRGKRRMVEDRTVNTCPFNIQSTVVE